MKTPFTFSSLSRHLITVSGKTKPKVNQTNKHPRAFGTVGKRGEKNENLNLNPSTHVNMWVHSMHPHGALVLGREAGSAVRALGPAGHQCARPCLRGKGRWQSRPPDIFLRPLCVSTLEHSILAYIPPTQNRGSLAQTVLEIWM